jgi:hypothetical protein
VQQPEGSSPGALSLRCVLPLLATFALSACGTTVPSALSSATTSGNEAGEVAGSTAGGVAPAGTDIREAGGNGARNRVGRGSSGASPATPGDPTSHAAPLPDRSSAWEIAPIKIGVLDTAAIDGAVSALGAKSSYTISGQEVMRALVAYFNAHGGIARRRIEMVEQTLNASDSNYETTLSAACATFTQDNHVAFVLSQVGLFFSDNYQTCLAKAGAPNIESRAGDDGAFDRYPRMFAPGAPSTNRQFAAVLRGLTRSGYLSPSSSIGLLVEDCAFMKRVYDKTFAPMAKGLGLRIVARRDVSCLGGFGDVGAFEAATSAAVLPFRTAGVDRVIYLSNWQALMMLAFDNNAKSQGYSPRYALTGSAEASSWDSNFTPDQLARVAGVGWSPDLDVSERVLPSRSTTRCRSAAATQGVKPSSKADDLLLDQTCEQFFAVESALHLSRGRSSAPTFVSALEALGDTYVSPFSIRGLARFGHEKHDGPVLFAPYAYVASCSCFRYTAGPTPLA